MPVIFEGILFPDQFFYLSGLAGIVSAFVILTIWSRGL